MRPSRPPSSIRFRGLAAAAIACVALGAAPATLAQPKPAPSSKAAASPPVAPPPATAGKAVPAGKPAASASGSAAAGAAPPELIEGTDEVQRLYLEGDAALKRLDFTGAESLLTKAWLLSKSFDVAGKLGEAKWEMGKAREAAQYASFALRNALPSTRPKTRERLKELLDKAKEKLATVKLSASVAEAKIAIDGAAVDPMFLGPEVFVDPGKRTFEASAEGYVTAKSELDVKAGEIHVVALTLERGAPKGVPTAAPPPPPGTPWPAAVVGGAGGLGLVAGAILVGVAESRKNDAYAAARKTLTAEGESDVPEAGPGPSADCDAVRAAAADVDVFGNAGIVAFAAGGVLIVGAAAYMLFLTPGAPKTEPGMKEPGKTGMLVPAIGPNGGGLLWTGSF